MLHRSWLLLFGLLLTACTEPAAAQRRESPPPLGREFRAAWVATVNNIDWPSRPGLPTRDAKAELDAIVRRALDLGLNALVFQVRPAADAMYVSAREPWSEWLTGAQGRAPDERWDPLQFLIELCHRDGLQLHAWFNPFRAGHPSGKSRPASNHVRSQLPSVCIEYGGNVWMDPGDPRAADWSLAVILDVVRRYDIDGVHIDDYFYPYPEGGRAFPDDASFERYRSAGGRQPRADWRRANIDAFVERLYRDVHREKSWVQVGISPFGIARPGIPAGIKAGLDQYADLYADVEKWLREGWYDYLSPQLYWPIDQEPQSFARLLPWWLAKNVHAHHVWPGLNAGRALAGKAPWRRDELSDQITAIRNADSHPGHVHFSFRSLRSDAANVGGALRTKLYDGPVIAPPSPWLGTEAPPPPRARLETGRRADILRWDQDRHAHFIAIQVRDASGWRTARVVGAEVGHFELPIGSVAIALSAIGRTGIQSVPTVL
ncbi:MAG: family 10 glycosylhydrolase [Planctomycetes bacterium]|nr:family 10 glycosylhydrolase [Planctomycetota bacterium]